MSADSRADDGEADGLGNRAGFLLLRQITPAAGGFGGGPADRRLPASQGLLSALRGFAPIFLRSCLHENCTHTFCIHTWQGPHLARYTRFNVAKHVLVPGPIAQRFWLEWALICCRFVAIDPMPARPRPPCRKRPYRPHRRDRACAISARPRPSRWP